MAISTYNAKLSYCATSTGTFTNIPIKDFPSVTGTKSSLETTTTGDNARTYIQGIFDTPETFDFTANYDKATLSTLNGLSAAQYFKLTFGDNSYYSWQGYVSASVNEGAVDEVLEMTITIAPTTVPTFTAAS